MTVKRDPDAILATWLEDGPSRLPHATRRAIAVGTRTTTQRRHGLAVLWRSLGMNPFARTGLAVIAVVLAIGGAALILNPPQPSVGAGVPSASPTRVATSSPTGASTPPAQSGPAASPISFTSPRYLYTLRYPSDYIVEPASTDWPIGAQALPTSTFLDRFTYAGPFGGPSVFVGVASQTIPEGAEWIADRQSAAASPMVAGCADGTGWQRIEVGEFGFGGYRFDATCDTYPGSEVIFVVNDGGWIVTGDRAAVDAILPTLYLH